MEKAMGDYELNMMRMHANEIIIKLFEHKKREQLELLKIAAEAALRHLNDQSANSPAEDN